MPTVSSSTAPADYTDILARSISAQFSTRPTLRSVTASLLKDDLLEKYPSLDFDPYRTQIAQPLPEGGWRLTLLLDVALDYLASARPPMLSEQFGRHCFLTNKAPAHLSLDGTGKHEPDMQLIADIIRELPAIVSVGFQEALSCYWNAPIEASVSRWQWLGDLLSGVLKTSATRLSSSNPQHADILSELCRHPDQRQRLEAPGANGLIQACILETTLKIGQLSVNLQSPDILVICGDTLLLCSPTGSIESFPSLDTFGQAWAARFEQAFMPDAVTWKRYKPDGNIFDTQAALLLNRQLEELAALRLPASQRIGELENRFETITDTAALFVGQPQPNPLGLQRIANHLPDWLQTADATDRMAYHKQVLALASTKRQTAGRTFQTGVEDLHTFAKNALHQQMSKDQPTAPGYDADQLELTFHVPVGDLSSGYIEPVKMTLTELAIRNLASKPKGRMTIRHKADQLIQDRTTEAYLLDLVSRVDIGKHYPQYLRTEFLADTAPALERGRLFDLELSVRLPTHALEHAIKAEHGFTRQGYRYVEALVHLTKAERHVDGQEIVIRPLAFQRKAGADCDMATNMFIIEPKDLTANGPRILYRPLYTPALQQYPSRQALLSEIAQPGLLQTSVLTWLPDRARPIYDNNGFNEPHIVHFYPGDEFTRPEKPQPAILAGDEAASEWLTALENGQLMTRLFQTNAQALVELADQQSVSNAESRWAIILEGSWLVFNNLILPLLRGPAMLAGWMLQLTHSLIQDLPALGSEDATTREQAWVDVLLNLGLVLLHVAQDRADVDKRFGAEPSWPPLADLLPSRRTTEFPDVATATLVTQAAPGLPSEPPGSGHTLLDFNLSVARDSVSARMFEQLHAVRVPWPASLPEPVAIGPFQGLYRIDGKWHATLAGLLFRVQIVPGFGEVFLVHPEHPDHPGIKLKTDGHGKWSLDQGLKLVGGGPKNRIAAAREQRRQRIAELDLHAEQFRAQQTLIQKRVDIAENLMLLKDKATTSNETERETFRQRFVAELEKQTDSYVTLLDEIKEKSVLTDLPVDQQQLSVLLENFINNVRKRIVIADYERNVLNLHYEQFSSGNLNQLQQALQIEGAAMVNRYMDFMRKTSEINETMIQSYEQVDAHLEQLKAVPLFGPQALERLTRDRPENELTTLRLKVFQLVVLKVLSVQTLGTDTMTAMESAISPLMMLSRTHAELHTAHVYNSADRIAVLDNLVDQYNKAQNALGVINVFDAENLEMRAFNRLRFILHDLHADAEQRLADELQRTEEPSAAPAAGSSKNIAKTPKKPAPSRKKVIKTAVGTFIGDIRPRIDDQGGDIVDINGPMEEKPLASFHEHAPNEWVEIVSASAPPPKSPLLPYPQLKGDARRTLAKVENQVQKIEGYAQRASSPKEIEEQLQREAQKLFRYADELERHAEAASASEKDGALVTELRGKAHALEVKATQLRTRMTLAQAPTSEGVEYLLQHHELHVQPIGRRTQLKSGRRDFMQEYALLDNNDQPCWYAHFHYASLTAEKGAYTAGHIKTREQRFESYESALAKATNPKQKIEIHRAAISRTLAEQRFLPLALQ